ncbi:prepilin peptidase [Microbacterium sp. M3]|uniref:Prepilin leader peptidase/N-methyltransferase n=1 Tax=Microbacterium arthrosphaerae TaxID=792652 RepID=A0ABU4GYT3_9MICO|nr:MULTISPECIES: prepilin peptidase [Microbacterium]MDW4572236.1 prepilin peptidase [Microbacterium arthrosphaerae]MDW7606091.1 prepilin peptidase [Microbacterium sp. M3]
MTGFTTFLVVVAGVLGLLIGSFLNVVAYRVPAKVSLLRGSRCPHCDTAIKPWHNVPVVGWIALGGKCANCKAPISPRYPIVEAITGAAFALVTWWGLTVYDGLLGTSLTTYLASPAWDGIVEPAAVWAQVIVIVAFLYFAAISIVLTLIDLDTHRLPNSIVLPSYLVAGVLFTVAAWLAGEWETLLRAGIGMAVLYIFYFLLRSIRRGGMGGGDVKLAGVIGIYLGWLGWGALAVGAFAAFVFGGVFGLVLMLARRAGRKTAIPFGPWMILGAWTGVFAGEAVGRWYVDLFVGA